MRLEPIEREVIIIERDHEAISNRAVEIISAIGVSKRKVALAMGSTAQNLHQLLTGTRRWSDNMIDKFNKAIDVVVINEQKKKAEKDAKQKKKSTRRRRPTRIPICSLCADNSVNNNTGLDNDNSLRRPGLDSQLLDSMDRASDDIVRPDSRSNGKVPDKVKECKMDGNFEAQQEFYEKATECLSEIEGLQDELTEIMEAAGIGVASWQKEEVNKANVLLDTVIEHLKSTQPKG